VLDTLLPPLQRGLLYAGVLVLAGAVAWRVAVAPGAAERLVPEVGGRSPDLGPLETRVARIAAWTALLLMPVWALRLHVQLLGFRDPFAPLSEDLAFLIGDTFWGTVWIAQGVVLVMLAGGFWIAARRPVEPMPARIPWGDPTPPTPLPWRWRGLAFGVVALAATLALSSHAMSVPSNRALAVTLDGAHTLAAGAWIGALALVLGSARGAASPERPSIFAAQLHAFSPVAMVSVGLLVFAGFLLSTQHVMAWGNLWGSPYGRVLLLKVGLAAGSWPSGP
jgi:copper transport protein